MGWGGVSLASQTIRIRKVVPRAYTYGCLFVSLWIPSPDSGVPRSSECSDKRGIYSFTLPWQRRSWWHWPGDWRSASSHAATYTRYQRVDRFDLQAPRLANFVFSFHWESSKHILFYLSAVCIFEITLIRRWPYAKKWTQKLLILSAKSSVKIALILHVNNVVIYQVSGDQYINGNNCLS